MSVSPAPWTLRLAAPPVRVPERLYVSSLRALQGCVLRGALGKELGRPAPQAISGLDGSAVHEVLEEVLHEVAGGASLREALAREGLRPRVRRVVAKLCERAAFTRRLTPQARAQLGKGQHERRTRVFADARHLARTLNNSGLLEGATAIHAEPEVPVELADGWWSARPDLVVVRPEKTVIVDYKTSRRELNTRMIEEQLKLYAAVWARVHGGEHFELQVLHPSPDKCVFLPCTVRDLQSFLDSLPESGREARARAGELAARPSADTCPGCPSRAACSSYWDARYPAPEAQYVDLDVRLVDWLEPQAAAEVRVLECPQNVLLAGETVRLVMEPALSGALPGVSPGGRLRVTGARLMRASEHSDTWVAVCRPPELGRAGVVPGAEVWVVREGQG